jgi:NADH dehydrogenase FAD-containing subunit
MTQQTEDALSLALAAVVVVGGGWFGWWLAGRVQDRLLRKTVLRQIEEFERRGGAS